MALLTVKVHDIVYDQELNPLSGAVVTAKMTGTEVTTDGIIAAKTTSVTSDETGYWEMYLIPNTLGTLGNQYVFTIEHESTGKILKKVKATVSITGELNAIIDLSPIAPTSYTDASFINIQNERILAQNAKDDAVTAQGASETVETNVSTAYASILSIESTLLAINVDVNAVAALVLQAQTAESNSASNAASSLSNKLSSETSAANALASENASATHLTDTTTQAGIAVAQATQSTVDAAATASDVVSVTTIAAQVTSDAATVASNTVIANQAKTDAEATILLAQSVQSSVLASQALAETAAYSVSGAVTTTNNNVTLTANDAMQTALDVMATSGDVVSVTALKNQVTLDAIQVDSDMIAALAAKGEAESAQTLAESARDDAVAAKDIAVSISNNELLTPIADHSANGTKVNKAFGESVVFGDLCYLKSDAKLWKANATAEATAPGMFMALETKAADASGLALKTGLARDDSWTWTAGDILYLNIVSGSIRAFGFTPVTDEVLQIIGTAESSTIIDFNPQMASGVAA